MQQVVTYELPLGSISIQMGLLSLLQNLISSPSPPRVLAIVPGFMPSTFINIILPGIDLLANCQVQFRFEIEQTITTRDIDWADVILLCRNTRPGQLWFDYLLKVNKPYIYDIDDNFFDIPGKSLDALYHRDPEKIYTLERYIKHASLVRVYSHLLYEDVQKINHQVVQVVPSVDFRYVSPRQSSRDNKTKIVYATSRKQDELFSIFLPALERILNDYGTKVEVYFWGFTPPTLIKHPGVHSIPMIWDYPAYLRRFSSAGYDIGLAPLLDDTFHRSKTNNKFREYGACQIAGIYSDVDVYSSCVQQRETGILVPNTTEAWYSAMKLLIESPDLRRSIQLSAYEYVKQNYSHEKFSQVWAEQIQNVIASSSVRDNRVVFVSNDLLLPDKNRKTFFKKVIRKVSEAGDLHSLFFLILQSVRYRFWTVVLFVKYKFLLWLISVRR